MRHEALPFDGADGFAAACCTVLQSGLDADERLIVLAGTENLDAVTDRLGPDAADVTLVPLDDLGRNPGRIVTMLHTFQAGADGRRCLGVNESVLPGRSPATLAEAQLAEFLLNDPSLSVWPLTLVCLYDTGTTLGPTLDSIRGSHAVLRGQDANPWFRPDGAAALVSAPLEAPPGDAARLLAGPQQLAEMRAFVRRHAGVAGLVGERVDDLVLAANEIVTNSVRYGGGRADVAMWAVDGGVVCDVRDTGHLTDALVGRITPVPSANSGRGVWLAHQLCDLVQVRSSPAGTNVRLYLLP